MEKFTIPVKTIEVRLSAIEVEAEDVCEARGKVETLLKEHPEETDCGEVTEYRNVVVCDDWAAAYDRAVDHPLTDAKGHVVLGRFGENAVLLLPESRGQRFVRAYGYDEETCEWSQGHYGNDPVSAWLEADGEYFSDGCVLFAREDVLNRIDVLNQANEGKRIFETDENVAVVKRHIAAWNFKERCEELLNDYIDDAVETCLREGKLDLIVEL